MERERERDRETEGERGREKGEEEIKRLKNVFSWFLDNFFSKIMMWIEHYTNTTACPWESKTVDAFRGYQVAKHFHPLWMSICETHLTGTMKSRNYPYNYYNVLQQKYKTIAIVKSNIIQVKFHWIFRFLSKNFTSVDVNDNGRWKMKFLYIWRTNAGNDL